MRMHSMWAYLLPLFCSTLIATAAPDKDSEKETEKGPPPKAYLDADKAGPNFQTQGEYVGAIGGGAKLGCQVIAKGEGRFLAVFLPGGLPGEGSDNKDRIETTGKIDGDKTTLGEEGKGYSGTITGDTLAGKTDKGEAFELKKTIRHSPTEGVAAPAGATVLFDGTNTDAWKGKMDDRHLLAYGAETKKLYSDFTMHVEFILPFKPEGKGQDRGNSGIYIQRRYEIQVLDSFGLAGLFNDCGSVYRVQPPLVNMCYPPLSWQTYDIDFTAARYDAEGKKTQDATVTVRHNGVVVQDHYDIKVTHSGAGKAEDPKQQLQAGPIWLQDHHNPVYFRNIWIIDKSETK